MPEVRSDIPNSTWLRINVAGVLHADIAVVVVLFSCPWRVGKAVGVMSVGAGSKGVCRRLSLPAPMKCDTLHSEIWSVRRLLPSQLVFGMCFFCKAITVLDRGCRGCRVLNCLKLREDLDHWLGSPELLQMQTLMVLSGKNL